MNHPSGQTGSILIFTLWLSAALAAAALLVGHTSMLHYRREANLESRLKADHATDGALRYVLQLLAGGTSTAGTLPTTDSYQAEDLAISDCRVWLLGHSDDLTAATPVFGLTDEAGKLNLNTATLDMLNLLPGMTQDLATAIIDWRQPGSTSATNSAELQTYMARNPPYRGKSAPFETVDEMRLLYGAVGPILNGRDRNRNGILEPWEKTLEGNQEQLTTLPDIGILENLTVSSSEPNTASGGGTKTDLNGGAETIRRALDNLFGASRGAAVAAAAGVGTTRLGSVLEFCVKAKLTDTEAGQILDRFTVDTRPVIPGRINVNTAGVAVLACVPGIGEDNAAKLVAYRKQNPDSLTSPLWVAKALDDAAAIAAGAYLTVRSYQLTADIVAVGPHGRGFRRTRFIIDTTTAGKPAVISRRDLSHLGWPLGDALYKSISTPDRQGNSST